MGGVGVRLIRATNTSLVEGSRDMDTGNIKMIANYAWRHQHFAEHAAYRSAARKAEEVAGRSIYTRLRWWACPDGWWSTDAC